MGDGAKRVYDFHFRASEKLGDDFIALALRSRLDRGDLVREAVAIIISIADTRPELDGPHLMAYILDATRPLRTAAAPSNGTHPSPVDDRLHPRQPTPPRRSGPDRKGHKH